MKKHPIHQTPEERAADAALKASAETTAAIKQLTASLRPADVSGVVSVLNKLLLATSSDLTVRKLEEIKSASLITNRELKKLNVNLEALIKALT